VGDVAAAFLRSLSAPFEGADAFNVRGSVVTMETFLESLRKVSGIDQVAHGDRRLPIAPDLDDSRLEARLGPFPRTTLDDGIAETYRRFVELREQGRLDLSDLDA
jgi:nucleoside-diphosphate-sugar epimerase